MTMRLIFGIDPGINGAIATLIDGEAGPFLDMPVMTVRDQNEVDGLALARFVREMITAHPGAYVHACIERVRAMPAGRNEDGSSRKQGAQTMFVFGDNYGKAKCVLEVLRIPYIRAEPASWKRYFGLIGTDKDTARQLAITRFPGAAGELKRKKDQGRADALLLALYLENTDHAGRNAA